MTGLGQLILRRLEIGQKQTAVLLFRAGKLDLIIGKAVRLDVQNVQRSLRKQFSRLFDLILQAHKALRVPEIQHVMQTHDPLLPIDQLRADGTDAVFPLIQPLVRPAVREHQAVHAEIPVVRIFSGVSPVMVDRPAVRRLALVGRVVAPLPHEAAAEAVVFVDLLHIIFDVPRAVPHGMHKFALHKGLFLPGRGKIFVDPLRGSIHMAFHIKHGFVLLMAFGLEMAALIMHQPGGILLLHPASGLFDARPHAGLVAQRPEDHAALVLVPQHISPGTVDHRFPVGRILHQLAEGLLRAAAILILHAVGFQIRLGDEIKAAFAAQLREPGRVGIMAGADGVDVGLLHDPQIEHGVHLRYHGAGERTAVMAVDALEFHGLFIDEHHAVADTDGPDPHALADHFFRRRDL